MNVKFKIGLKENLPKTDINEGSWYLCKDVGELYYGSSNDQMILIDASTNLKTLKINANNGLNGGGEINSTNTILNISHKENTPTIEGNGLISDFGVVTDIEFDNYGHPTKVIKNELELSNFGIDSSIDDLNVISKNIIINGTTYKITRPISDNSQISEIFAPSTSGSLGQILVSAGENEPEWSDLNVIIPESLAGTELPQVSNIANTGTSNKYAREDHVHPKASYTANEVGAVPKGGLKTINNQSLEGTGNIQTLQISDFEDNFVKTSQIGKINGVASLNESGIIPSNQLPSYVDDVIDVYATYNIDIGGSMSNIKLYKDPEHSNIISTGESGKIYINVTDDEPSYNFRWTGTEFVYINTGGVVIGEVTGTAYDGKKGKDTTDKLNTHISDYNNPHKVTKVHVGLGNVDNTSDLNKPISTATQKALNNKLNNPNGTSSQFIKGDGSLDSNEYVSKDYVDSIKWSSINLVDKSESCIAKGDKYANVNLKFNGKLEIGKQYAVSIGNIVNESGSPTEYYVAITNVGPLSNTLVLTQENKTGVITITKDTYDTARLYLYAGVPGDPSTATNIVRFENVMVVEGNQPSPQWYPSYNDLVKKDHTHKTSDITLLSGFSDTTGLIASDISDNDSLNRALKKLDITTKRNAVNNLAGCSEYIKVNSSTFQYSNRQLSLNRPIVKGKFYTVTVESIEEIVDEGYEPAPGFSIRLYDADTLETLSNFGTLTKEKLTVTFTATASSTKYPSILFYAGIAGDSTIGRTTTFNKVIVTEGTTPAHQWYPSYDDMIRKVTDRNLLRLFDLEQGKINTTTGNNEESITCVRTRNFVPISSSTLYAQAFYSRYYDITIFYYTEDKTFISAKLIMNGTTREKVNVPSNTKYIKFFLTRINAEYVPDEEGNPTEELVPLTPEYVIMDKYNRISISEEDYQNSWFMSDLDLYETINDDIFKYSSELDAISESINSAVTGPSSSINGQVAVFNGSTGKVIKAVNASTLSVGSAANATSADKVDNSLTLSINSGTTEGTNKYTFNGSAAKSLNLVAGENISFTTSSGKLTINSNTPDLSNLTITNGKGKGSNVSYNGSTAITATIPKTAFPLEQEYYTGDKTIEGGNIYYPSSTTTSAVTFTIGTFTDDDPDAVIIVYGTRQVTFSGTGVYKMKNLPLTGSTGCYRVYCLSRMNTYQSNYAVYINCAEYESI